MNLVALVPALFLLALPSDAFHAASRLLADGKFEAAAHAFEEFAKAHSNDELADDALYEAAEICEESLGNPERALVLYREIGARYAGGRLAARAEARATELGRNLAKGVEPLVEYRAIEREARTAPKTETERRLQALLDKYPTFPLAEAARYWLATVLAEGGRHREALGVLAAFRRPLDSELAQRSLLLRAHILVAMDEPAGAISALEELRGGTLAPAAAEVHRVIARNLLRSRLAGIALFEFILYVLLSAITLARSRIRVSFPLELRYYLPIAFLFVGAALTENPAIGKATAMIATAGAGAAFFAGQRAPRAPVRIFGATVSVLAALYFSLYAQNLLDLVLATVREGPER